VSGVVTLLSWLDFRHLQKSANMDLTDTALAKASKTFHRYINGTDLHRVAISDCVAFLFLSLSTLIPMVPVSLLIIPGSQLSLSVCVLYQMLSKYMC